MEDQVEAKQVKYLFFSSKYLGSNCTQTQLFHSEPFTALGLYLPLKILAFDLCLCTSYNSEHLKTFSMALMAIGNLLQTLRSGMAVLKTF